MRKFLQLTVLASAVALSGCVLAPQTIQLNETVALRGKVMEPREALVRVVDQRDSESTKIGHRGGRSAGDSPVYSDEPIDTVLTKRLQNSLEQLGFGQEESFTEPLKVQLEIQKFHYGCNESVIVNECTIEIRFLSTVHNGNKTFKKPYGNKELRSLAASPVQEYNQRWINEALDKVWQYMFTDPEFKQAIGAY